MEGFKKYVAEENKVQEDVERKNLLSKIEEDKKKITDLEVMEKRGELRQELLEKYPEILFLQRYSEYLESQASGMADGKVKGLNIVDHDGNFESGNLAEVDLLQDVNIKPDTRVLSLRSGVTNFEKSQVFEDLVGYFSDSEFQKDEVCKLGKISTNFFVKKLSEKGHEVDSSDVKFLTGVGTTLDFNFGVDAWVEVTDSEKNTERVYFDMKTGARGSKTEYADLLLNLEEKDGKIDMKNSLNLESVRDFVYKLVDVYIDKKNSKIDEDKEAA